MQDSDRKPFSQALVVIAEQYQNIELTDTLMETWFAAMKPYSLDAVKKALWDHVRTPGPGSFFPKIAEVIALLDGTPSDRALKAWSKVFWAIGRHGSWQSLVFDDPIIHQVISDMGGWEKLCSMKNTEVGYVQSDFTKRYQGYTRRPPEQYPKVIRGLGTMHHDDPVIVGDPEQAKLVYEQAQGEPAGVTTIRRLLDDRSANRG